MAVTVKQVEAAPESYPLVPGFAGTNEERAMIWQRIESYIAYRWTPRTVTWIVEGCGEWCPPLTPATITTVEVWSSADVWETIALSPSPLGGFWLSAPGPFRFTGSVGSGTVPAVVNEAFKRLAEYMAANRGRHAGASSESVSIGEAIRTEFRRDPAWMALAMVNSGAADLLRNFRRAA